MPDAPGAGRVNDPDSVERPQPGKPGGTLYGSDCVAEVLRALDIPYIALNPGASFRGLHDSLVNYLGNRNPRMLLCLHEEHAVAIAHGWAKVTGRPMAAALHSNVGLMHGAMAIYNAWCDRVPMLVIGATGPVDAAKRRPWIDWIHTARDQGALVRNYTKWDDQPASPAAAVEALLRANLLATTSPAARPTSTWTPPCKKPRRRRCHAGHRPVPCPRAARARSRDPAHRGGGTASGQPTADPGRARHPRSGGMERPDPSCRTARGGRAHGHQACSGVPQQSQAARRRCQHVRRQDRGPALQQADVVLSLDWNDCRGR